MVLFLAVLVIGCRKEYKDSVHLSGTVKDKFTLTPIEGAEIYIYEELEYSATGSTHGASSRGETYSGGEFSYYPKGMRKDHVVTKRELVITKENVIREGTGRAPVGGLQDEVIVHAEVITDCRINYRFINTTPYDAYDSVYNIYVARPWGQQVVGTGANILAGPSINISLLSGYYGYSETILHYTVKKNGIATERMDTLFRNDPFTCTIINDTINY